MWSKVLKPDGIAWQPPLPPAPEPVSLPSPETYSESPEAAYRRGYEAGRADGVRETEERAREALRAVSEEIDRLAERLGDQVALALDRLGREVADIALAVAERVVARRLADPTALAARVAAAVARRPTGSVLRVYVAAQAAPIVAERLASLGVEVEGVLDLSGGDFRLEGADELFDGSLATALQEIREALLGELGGGEA